MELETIKNQRANILKALTLALDACIEQEGKHFDGYELGYFDVLFSFRFKGTESRIHSHPAIDFDNPIEPQLRHARIVELNLKTDLTDEVV